VQINLSQCNNNFLLQTDTWADYEIEGLKDILAVWINEDLERAPDMLRLAFHSCAGNCPINIIVSITSFADGCVGCLNLNDPDNGGLDYFEIEALYQDTFPTDQGKVREK